MIGSGKRLTIADITACVQEALDRHGVNVSIDGVKVVQWQDQPGAEARVPREVEMTVRVHSMNIERFDLIGVKLRKKVGDAGSDTTSPEGGGDRQHG